MLVSQFFLDGYRYVCKTSELECLDFVTKSSSLVFLWSIHGKKEKNHRVFVETNML